MFAEKRTDGDIQVRQRGIPSCSVEDVQYSGEVLPQENYRIRVIGNRGIMLV